MQAALTILVVTLMTIPFCIMPLVTVKCENEIPDPDEFELMEPKQK